MFDFVEAIGIKLGIPKGMFWTFIIVLFGAFSAYSFVKGLIVIGILLAAASVSVIAGCVDKYNM